ncbi:hypothetical protein K0M31_016880 [Melipona bicolor]|uniref:Uncharacterized protein n=1 Tax=Melipona bicolor TaxID=60889 RepID=A0AA40FDU8_9HYME|nr:hypothetical protein K0M31_016868 [Melipona bicolor]KAK1117183.1 hypothetical protein K0M31_016880 [Melipona bicolor]
MVVKSSRKRKIPDNQEGHNLVTEKLSWVSPNLSSFCTPNSTLSACQPSTFMFPTLVANLSGHFQDSYPNKDIGRYRQK